MARLSDRLAAALDNASAEARSNVPANDPYAPARIRTQLPKVTFLPDEAENEIRRSVTRHYAQIGEIEALKTDLEHWRNRAQLAESENERLAEKLKDSDVQIDELKRGIATLHTQFHNGAQMWITGYRTLRDLNQVYPLAPKANDDIDTVMPSLEAMKAVTNGST